MSDYIINDESNIRGFCDDLSNLLIPGLMPIFGVGRSGKSYFANYISINFNVELIKVGEHDSLPSDKEMVIDCWYALEAFLMRLEDNDFIGSTNKIIIIDSFRDLLYGNSRSKNEYPRINALFDSNTEFGDYGSMDVKPNNISLRTGGISNNFSVGMLRLSQLAIRNNICVLPIINPITSIATQAKELFLMCDASSIGGIIMGSSDINYRASIHMRNENIQSALQRIDAIYKGFVLQ